MNKKQVSIYEIKKKKASNRAWKSFENNMYYVPNHADVLVEIKAMAHQPQPIKQQINILNHFFKER